MMKRSLGFGVPDSISMGMEPFFLLMNLSEVRETLLHPPREILSQWGSFLILSDLFCTETFLSDSSPEEDGALLTLLLSPLMCYASYCSMGVRGLFEDELDLDIVGAC
jgi:hypothetical protein